MANIVDIEITKLIEPKQQYSLTRNHYSVVGIEINTLNLKSSSRNRYHYLLKSSFLTRNHYSVDIGNYQTYRTKTLVTSIYNPVPSPETIIQ